MKKITLIFGLFLAFCSQGYSQFTEGFESGIPATWTVINGGDANTWVHFTTPTVFVISGTGSAVITYSATAHDDYLITPAITVTAGVNDRFSFKARSFDPLYPEEFDLVVSTTTPTAGAFTTTLATIAPDSNLTTATDYSFDLSAFVGQTIYIGMYSTTTDMWRISVDDVVNDTPPLTVPPCAANPVSTPDASCGNFTSNISWDAVASATGYYLNVGTTPGGTNVVNNATVTATTYALTTQTPGTTYYWTVTPFNNVGPATGCTENSYTTNAAGCYCTSVPTSNDGSGITNVMLGTANFPNGDVTYFDHTATAVDLAQGVTAPAMITFATGYSYDTNIWIDLNDDFDFTDAGELVKTGVASTATNPTTLDASFVMPATAPLGMHRMRIGTADVGQVPPNPCYSGTWGVTLDFTVNVTTASCVPPAGTATLVSTCVANQFFVDVNVTALGNGTPSITDGITSWPVTATGTVQVGPFASASTATLTLLHGGDSLCNLPLGSFTYTCPPSNDNLATPIAVSCGNTYTGSTTAATLDEDNAPDGFGADLDARNLWYSFTGSGTAQTVTVNLCGSAYDTSVLVYTGTSGSLTLVAANDDDNTCVSNALNSKVIFNSDGVTTYYITVEGYNATSFGNFTMAVSCENVNPPAVPNQNCDVALDVAVDGVDVNSDNSYGTVNATQPACDLFGAIQDVWFAFVAPASGTVDVLITPGSMTSANFNVYSGPCSALVAVGNTCNSNLTAATTENLTGLTPGDTYFVQVWSNSSEQGTFDIRLTDPNLATDTFDNASFAYYPNPVTNLLNLSYTKNIDSVQVINLVGQEVLVKSLNAAQGQVDMSNLPTGTYLVKVTADNQVKTIKVVKE